MECSAHLIQTASLVKKLISPYKPRHDTSQVIVLLELIPSLVQRAEDVRADHALLGRRVLRDLIHIMVSKQNSQSHFIEARS
jgi:hypothetical protein